MNTINNIYRYFKSTLNQSQGQIQGQIQGQSQNYLKAIITDYCLKYKINTNDLLLQSGNIIYNLHQIDFKTSKNDYIKASIYQTISKFFELEYKIFEYLHHTDTFPELDEHDTSFNKNSKFNHFIDRMINDKIINIQQIIDIFFNYFNKSIALIKTESAVKYYFYMLNLHYIIIAYILIDPQQQKNCETYIVKLFSIIEQINNPKCMPLIIYNMIQAILPPNKNNKTKHTIRIYNILHKIINKFIINRLNIAGNTDVLASFIYLFCDINNNIDVDEFIWKKYFLNSIHEEQLKDITSYLLNNKMSIEANIKITVIIINLCIENFFNNINKDNEQYKKIFKHAYDFLEKHIDTINNILNQCINSRFITNGNYTHICEAFRYTVDIIVHFTFNEVLQQNMVKIIATTLSSLNANRYSLNSYLPENKYSLNHFIPNINAKHIQNLFLHGESLFVHMFSIFMNSNNNDMSKFDPQQIAKISEQRHAAWQQNKSGLKNSFCASVVNANDKSRVCQQNGFNFGIIIGYSNFNIIYATNVDMYSLNEDLKQTHNVISNNFPENHFKHISAINYNNHTYDNRTLLKLFKHVNALFYTGKANIQDNKLVLTQKNTGVIVETPISSEITFITKNGCSILNIATAFIIDVSLYQQRTIRESITYLENRFKDQIDYLKKFANQLDKPILIINKYLNYIEDIESQCEIYYDPSNNHIKDNNLNMGDILLSNMFLSEYYQNDSYTPEFAGWNGIKNHTQAVLTIFRKYFLKEYKIYVANKIDTEFMEMFLALHDIGKGKNKDTTHQHTNTKNTIKKFFYQDRQNYSVNYQTICNVICHLQSIDPIGSCFQNLISQQDASQIMWFIFNKINRYMPHVDELTFIYILEIFYKSDAGSYKKVYELIFEEHITENDNQSETTNCKTKIKNIHVKECKNTQNSISIQHEQQISDNILSRYVEITGDNSFKFKKQYFELYMKIITGFIKQVNIHNKLSIEYQNLENNTYQEILSQLTFKPKIPTIEDNIKIDYMSHIYQTLPYRYYVDQHLLIRDIASYIGKNEKLLKETINPYILIDYDVYNDNYIKKVLEIFNLHDITVNIRLINQSSHTIISDSVNYRIINNKVEYDAQNIILSFGVNASKIHMQQISITKGIIRAVHYNNQTINTPIPGMNYKYRCIVCLSKK